MNTLPDNRDRADWALQACRAFVLETRHHPGELDGWRTGDIDAGMADEVIGDLICDLLHLADVFQLDPIGLHANAYDAYLEEWEEEQEGAE